MLAKEAAPITAASDTGKIIEELMITTPKL